MSKTKNTTINLNTIKLKTNNQPNHLYYYPPIDYAPSNNSNDILDPDNEDYFLHFYLKHMDIYNALSQSVKAICYLSKDLTRVNWRICNYVSLTYKDHKCNTYLTSYDLLNSQDKSVVNCDLFLVDDIGSDLRSLCRYIEYLTQIECIEEKRIMLDWIKEEYKLVEMVVDIDMMMHRIDFLKRIENTSNDYVFRDSNDDIPRPSLGVLFLNKKSNTLGPDSQDTSFPIVIPVKTVVTKGLLNKESRLTYITYHFPFESSQYYALNDKVEILMKYAKIHKIEGVLSSQASTVHLEHRRPISETQESPKYLYYQQSIGFGSTRRKGLNPGMIEADFCIGECSHGTVVFNESFDAVGLVFAGNSCESVSKVYKRQLVPNLYIPFNNIGFAYLMLKCIGKACNDEELLKKTVENFLKENKFDLSKGSVDCFREQKKDSIRDENERKEESDSPNEDQEGDSMNKPQSEKKMETAIIKGKRGRPPSKSKKRLKLKKIMKIDKRLRKKRQRENEKRNPPSRDKKNGEGNLHIDEMYSYDKTFLQIKRKRQRVSLSRYNKYVIK